MVRFSLVVAASAFVLSSCGSSESEPTFDDIPADIIEYELLDTTIVLEAEALDSLVSMDDNHTLRFSSVPPALADLSAERVLLLGRTPVTPSGLPLLVTNVERAGDELLVHGSPAPLQMVFERLNLRAVREVRDLDTGAPTLVGPGGRTQTLGQPLVLDSQVPGDIDFFLFNGDGDPSTLDDQARITGRLGGGFRFEINIVFDWKSSVSIPLNAIKCGVRAIIGRGCEPKDLLPEVGLDFDVESNAAAQIAVEGAAFRGFSEEYVIGTIPLGNIPIGVVVLNVTVEVQANLEAEASSQFALAAGANATLGFGSRITTRDGLSFDGPRSDFEFTAPEVRATLGARAYVDVGPELNVKIYGLAGPTAGLFAFAELRADNEANPCFTLDGGVRGSAGIEVSLPNLPLIGTIKLFDWNQDFSIVERRFLDGDCELVGTEPPADPVNDDGGWAGDPREAVFREPEFNPWALSFNDVVDGHPVEGLGAQAEWTDLTATIDGRFVVAGSDVVVLSKVDREGELIWARSYRAEQNWPKSFIREVMVGRTVQGQSPDLWVVGHPYIVMKVSQDGALRWAERFFPPDTGDRWLRFTGAAAAPDAGLYVAGNYGTDSAVAGATDAWVLRLDRNGEVLWSRRFGDPLIGDMVRDAVTAPDGGLIVTGSRLDDDAGDWWPWMARFDADGTLLFARHYPTCGSIGAEAHTVSVSLAPDGDILLAGGGLGESGRASLVMKVGPTDGVRSFLSTETVAGGVGAVLTDLVPLPTTGYLGVGTYDGFSAGQDFWVGGFSGLAEILWAARLGGMDRPETLHREDDSYPAAILTRDGGVIIAGASQGFGDNGILVAKVPARDGAIDFDEQSTAERVSLAGFNDFLCIGDELWNPAVTDLVVTKEAQSLTIVEQTRPVVHHAQ